MTTATYSALARPLAAQSSLILAIAGIVIPAFVWITTGLWYTAWPWLAAVSFEFAILMAIGSEIGAAILGAIGWHHPVAKVGVFVSGLLLATLLILGTFVLIVDVSIHYGNAP